jgi:hypothetical protein
LIASIQPFQGKWQIPIFSPSRRNMVWKWIGGYESISWCCQSHFHRLQLDDGGSKEPSDQGLDRRP